MNNNFAVKSTTNILKTLYRETGISPKQLKWWFVTRRRVSKCTNTKTKQNEVNQSECDLNLKKWQIKSLEDYFEADSCPLGNSLTEIANKVQLDRVMVYNWFKGRRDQTQSDEEENIDEERRTEKFNDDQWKILVDFYENTNPYPTRSEMKVLAKKVNTTRLRIKRWFITHRRGHHRQRQS